MKRDAIPREIYDKASTQAGGSSTSPHFSPKYVYARSIKIRILSNTICYRNEREGKSIQELRHVDSLFSFQLILTKATIALWSRLFSSFSATRFLNPRSLPFPSSSLSTSLTEEGSKGSRSSAKDMMVTRTRRARHQISSYSA